MSCGWPVLAITLFSLIGINVSTYPKQEKPFEGHKVLRVVPKNIAEVSLLTSLMERDDLQLDFWTRPHAAEKAVDIRVSPKEQSKLRKELQRLKLEYTVSVENVEDLIESERKNTYYSSSSYDASYHNYNEIKGELNRLASAYSRMARVFSLGKTYEGNDMMAIQIKSPSGPSNKPLFFFNCGIHAREWISPATCMFMLRKMLNEYNRDPSIKDMLDRVEFVILPVLNVDGYIYTHSSRHNRLWRKTRSRNPGRSCRGTDPNRNFNYRWAGTGTNPSNPCSEIYPGSKPFSEKCAYNTAKYLMSRRKDLKAYIDFHSFGQMWMSPWGYSKKYPPTYNSIIKPALDAAVNALQSVHGTYYKRGPAAIVIYPTTGDTTDWTYGVLGVHHSYCVELRPQSSGAGGFILHESKIIPTGQETFAGLKALAKFL